MVKDKIKFDLDKTKLKLLGSFTKAFNSNLDHNSKLIDRNIYITLKSLQRFLPEKTE